ncbi:hypothetical protein [Bradyrhizobium guangzhouense]|uniref:hypothetical protein n=1 Tax=Bradyrhizobium guangzhouense TaxID=1325095 RepID=UPI0010099C1D|nr:hypothetical protein [Bradyrhizobium guangzhouense]
MLDRVDGMSHDERMAFKLLQERKILTLAQSCDRYRGRAGYKLSEVPLLNKDDVRSNPAQFIRKFSFPTTNALTSGTTGASLRLVRSVSSVVFEQAAMDWILFKVGLNYPASRVAVFRGIDIKKLEDNRPPFWRLVRPNHLVFSSNHLNRDNVAEFAKALAEFRPDVLYGYPSVLESLERLLRESHHRISVPFLVTSSETFATESRKRLSTFFSAISVDIYGQAERAAMAYSVEPDQYWFLPSYGTIELLGDREDRDGLEIVGSSYHNSAQLLLRYRTGDRIGRIENLDEVCLGVRSFGKISGRTNDVLIGPGGQVLSGIDHIPRGLDNFSRFQFIQHAVDDVEIRAVAAEVPSLADEADIVARARRKIPSTINLRINLSEAPLRSASGKTPFVVQRIVDGQR